MPFYSFLEVSLKLSKPTIWQILRRQKFPRNKLRFRSSFWTRNRSRTGTSAQAQQEDPEVNPLGPAKWRHNSWQKSIANYKKNQERKQIKAKNTKVKEKVSKQTKSLQRDTGNNRNKRLKLVSNSILSFYVF